MEINELLQWLSGGPNFSPFTGLRGPVQVIFALVLAVVALFGLYNLGKGFLVWGTAGRNPQKRHNGLEDIKQGGLQILVVFALGLVLTILGSVLSAVFDTI